MTDAAPAIGLDIGGTKIVGAVVDRAGTLLSHERVPTPVDGTRRTAELVALVRRLRKEHDLAHTTVGVGAAGLVDLDG
ncbi:MAG TPA: ROK family protein, partial [Euzebyales bacterium]|nr:ROK family protein [Euzebyales bacterium]